MCSVTKVALIINERHFYYAFEAYNPQCISSHFCGISLFTKNMCYTPGLSTCSLSFQFSTPVLHKSWDRKLNVCFGSIDFFSVSSILFHCRTQSNSIYELSLIEFDCVWLTFTLIGFNLLCQACYTTLARQPFSFNVMLLWCETKFINYINLLYKHQWDIWIFSFTRKSYLHHV